METCENSLCNNPAVVEKVIDAPFSMTSTSTKSRVVKKICLPCHNQDIRMKDVGYRASLK